MHIQHKYIYVYIACTVMYGCIDIYNACGGARSKHTPSAILHARLQACPHMQLSTSDNCNADRLSAIHPHASTSHACVNPHRHARPTTFVHTLSSDADQRRAIHTLTRPYIYTGARASARAPYIASAHARAHLCIASAHARAHLYIASAHARTPI